MAKNGGKRGFDLVDLQGQFMQASAKPDLSACFELRAIYPASSIQLITEIMS